MNSNICKFIPYKNDYLSIHTINFIYETIAENFNASKSEAVYKIYLVCSGNATVQNGRKTEDLSKGDVFFTFPGTPSRLLSVSDFSYMYISFIGTRGNMILDKLRITPNRFVFKNCSKLIPIWNDAIEINDRVADLSSEGILLYTFSYLANKHLTEKRNRQSENNAILFIKKYIDENLTDPAISLSKISRNLNYNPKYISYTFKKTMKIGFSEYLNSVRIQYACTLIDQGFTSVSEIARMCGYSDSYYFSNVFKKKMGVSPKEYAANEILFGRNTNGC